MDQIQIGKFISAIRHERNLTQLQLANLLEISPKTVSKWETGKGLPEVSLMLPLCDALGITVNELLSGQRLDNESYQEKAEENLMKIINEKKENQQRMAWTLFTDLAVIVIGFSIALIAAHFEMPQIARQLLCIAALLVCVLDVLWASLFDRTTGYFQCSHCQEVFVPDMKTYFKGAWSVLPGSARFTCPHCGKTGKCIRKLER